ncbi:hypothetical protein GS506_17685 [Rhodococcus hoagii]|nr:hypothetical protein [Prescottella equi]
MSLPARGRHAPASMLNLLASNPIALERYPSRVVSAGCGVLFHGIGFWPLFCR